MTIEQFAKFFEKYDTEVYVTEEKETGKIYIELEFYSPAGEDVIEGFWTTEKELVKDYDLMADGFDPDEHAELYVEYRGEKGVPNSIRELIDDADWIKGFLTKTAAELLAIEKAEKQQGEKPQA